MAATQNLGPLREELRKQFTISTEKMCEIVDQFSSELARGLTEKADIPMNPTWCMSLPTGDETGKFLAIDLGGTNLRVCEIELLEQKGQFSMIQDKYRLPDTIRTSNADELWTFVANCVGDFVKKHHGDQKVEDIPLGFTFSYPATQNYIDHGILQTWTKGFDISGVEGFDAAEQLQNKLAELNIPVKITALVNDTVGTLMACAYAVPNVKIGCIFGTGCNAAYMEDCGSIPKLADRLAEFPYVKSDMPMSINCEWGAFDNQHKVLPRTKYDIKIDEDSPRPGEQTFEKMIAGYYLGEILRYVLTDLVHNPDAKFFAGQDTSKLVSPTGYVDSVICSLIEEDTSDDYAGTIAAFQNQWGLTPNKEELALIRELAALIGTRAARLSSCGVAGICKKKGYTNCKVAADGTIFNKYPHFEARGAQALREIFKWGDDVKEDPIKIIHAEDGSGVGAAIITALTVERIKQGNLAGVKTVAENQL